MRLTVCVALIAIAVFLVRSPAQQPLDGTDTHRVTVHDLSDNIRVRLVAAKISKTRGQYLEIDLVRLGGADETGRLVVRFPSHSHTPHVATLRAIVRSCVNWNEPRNAHESHQAATKVVFSIPKDTQWDHTDFEKWWLVSLQCTQDD